MHMKRRLARLEQRFAVARNPDEPLLTPEQQERARRLLQSIFDQKDTNPERFRRRMCLWGVPAT